ncbi:MAG: CHASE domain-containing protein [Acidimicrobiia bacterium]|nr:CHASE domain-containing protein [Acidimicrobiia bacterium]
MKFKSKVSSPIIASVIIFILGLTATYVTWNESRDKTFQRTETQQKEITNSLESGIRTKTTAIEEILHGTMSFTSNYDFNSDRFSKYLDSLKISQRYSSIDSIGYIALIDSEELEPILAIMRQTIDPNFTIYPSSKQEKYAPVLFIKSIADKYKRSNILGLNLFSDKKFSELLEKANKESKPTFSGLTSFTGYKDNDSQSSIVYISPIYSSSNQISANITGYVFATIRASSMIRNVVAAIDPNINVSVYDSKIIDKSKLLYGIYDKNTTDDYLKTFNIGGRSWLIDLRANTNTSSNSNNQSGTLLILGFVLSLLISLFLLFVIKSKSREIELEKQLDIDSAKEDLISLASHQLRTPATSVKQYLGLVLEGYVGDITKEQEMMLTKANESNERQLAVVNQILNLSKLDNNSVTLKKIQVDLISLANDVILDQTLLLSDMDVTVKPKESKIFADVDPLYMRMVIENLVTNAAKYSSTSTNIDIEISESQEEFCVAIRDYGIGIESEDLDNLFVLFNRIDNDLTTNISGTGIGLYISKLIVNLHGGTIEVESVIGEGSTFKVCLPKEADGTTNAS